MIEEQGRIVAVEGDYAWVETRIKTTCNSCAVQSGCGTSVLSKVLGRKLFRTRIANALGARQGDDVMIAIPEDTLVRASLVVYLLPLAGLVIGAVAARILLPGSHEVMSIMAGVTGFAGGLLAAKTMIKRGEMEQTAVPEMVRILPRRIPVAENLT